MDQEILKRDLIAFIKSMTDDNFQVRSKTKKVYDFVRTKGTIDI